MTVFKAIIAAMSGSPTLIPRNPLCPPERQIELASELMEEWDIEGIAARVTADGVLVDRVVDADGAL